MSEHAFVRSENSQLRVEIVQLSSVFGQTPKRAEGKLSQRENPRRKRKAAADSNIFNCCCLRKWANLKAEEGFGENLFVQPTHSLSRASSQRKFALWENFVRSSCNRAREQQEKARHERTSLRLSSEKIREVDVCVTASFPSRGLFLCRFVCARVKVAINQVPPSEPSKWRKTWNTKIES